jgi:hypothetical protein
MKKFFMIQAPEGDLLTGGGSQGAGDPPANSQSVPPAAPAAPPAAPPVQIAWPENWKDGLGDLAKDPTLGSIQNIPELAKSFVHAQKMIGKDKIIIPDKFATPEDWNKQVWSKLGLPDAADKYEFKAPEGTDPGFLGKFKDFAIKSGILPNQAEALFGFYSGYTKEVIEAQDSENKQMFESAVADLKKEFGVAYEKKLGVASNFFNTVADDATKKLFQETGLGNNPVVIKMFAKIAAMNGEDKFVNTQEKGNLGLTPAEAQTKINEIMGNKDHPYFNKAHPSHTNAVAEMAKLFAMQSPS